MMGRVSKLPVLFLGCFSSSFWVELLSPDGQFYVTQKNVDFCRDKQAIAKAALLSGNGNPKSLQLPRIGISRCTNSGFWQKQ